MLKRKGKPQITQNSQRTEAKPVGRQPAFSFTDTDHFLGGIKKPRAVNSGLRILELRYVGARLSLPQVGANNDRNDHDRRCRG
jgi:hypothetical protein